MSSHRAALKTLFIFYSLVFPGLNKLLDFQRRFLIKLEGVAEPWKEQRWRLPFVKNVGLVSIIMIKILNKGTPHHGSPFLTHSCCLFLPD